MVTSGLLMTDAIDLRDDVNLGNGRVGQRHLFGDLAPQAYDLRFGDLCQVVAKNSCASAAAKVTRTLVPDVRTVRSHFLRRNQVLSSGITYRL